jgi:SAM-dependent methyltransferase
MHSDRHAPSPWVARFAALAPPGGTVLDVASGAGRHARLFAARGCPVIAIDRDVRACASLAGVPGVRVYVADLEGAPWPLPDLAGCGAVVVTRYLHRPFMPRLVDLVAPGGVFIAETFARGNATVGRPSNPDFLLCPGELLELVRGKLRVIAYEDGFSETGGPAFVQRICAVRELADLPVGTPPRWSLDT